MTGDERLALHREVAAEVAVATGLECYGNRAEVGIVLPDGLATMERWSEQWQARGVVDFDDPTSSEAVFSAAHDDPVVLARRLAAMAKALSEVPS